MPGKAVIVLWGMLLAACGGGGGSGGEGGMAPPPPEQRDVVFFSAHEAGGEPARLWRTDGTGLGTVRVHDSLMPDFGTTTLIAKTTLLADRHYLAGAQAGQRAGLWVTDGSAQGTSAIHSALYAGPYDVRDMVELDARIFFSAAADQGRDLWASDGTPEGTARIDGLTASGCPVNPQALRVVAGYLMFFGDVDCNGTQTLVRLDTTRNDATALWALSGSSRGEPVVLRGLWVVPVREGSSHRLLAIDPVDGARTLLLELPALGDLAIFEYLTRVGDHLYFVATETTHGRELWVTDGTFAGTRMVENKTPGPGSTQFQSVRAAAGKLVYVAPVLSSAHRIWAVDSPQAVAREVYQPPATGFSSPALHFDHEGVLYFFMVAEDMVRRLCRVDLEQGAHGCLQQRLSPALGFGMLALNDELLFIGYTNELGQELWRSDTLLGTAEIISDICPGRCNGHL